MLTEKSRSNSNESRGSMFFFLLWFTENKYLLFLWSNLVSYGVKVDAFGV